MSQQTKPLTATYLRSRWCSPDGGLQISEVESHGNGYVVAGPGLPPLVKGQTYRFVGAWEQHPTHGRQYRYAHAVRDLGVDREGMVAYLSLLDGIGEGRATRLWMAFGPDAVATLRDRPAHVAAGKYLPAEVAFAASRALQRDAWRERVTLEVYSLLAKRGFQVAKVVEESVKLWGQRAAEMIRRSPYSLHLKGVTSCGWLRTDKLYLDMGGRRDAIKRQALCGLVWVKERAGDTWHPAEGVCLAIRAACGPASDPLRALKLSIRARLLTLWRDGEDRYVALTAQARDEGEVARLLGELGRPHVAKRKPKFYHSVDMGHYSSLTQTSTV